VCFVTLRCHNSPRCLLHQRISYRYLLGAFAELQKATISVVVSVSPSGTMQQLDSKWTDFREIWFLDIYPKYVGKIQVSLKSDEKNG